MSLTNKAKLILCVVGARPNFMKIAPILRAMQEQANTLKPLLVHTGQHYDQEMKHSFFQQLAIPEPDIDLEVGSGTHAWQTAEVMQRIEPVMDQFHPDCVLVVGDVNSTVAAALVASKKKIQIVHVEAGLRSYDRDMPEEVNRVLTDQLSNRLYTTERDAEANLVKEGINRDSVCFVGNVMIDTLKQQLSKAVSIEQLTTKINKPVILNSKRYAMLTLHRPSNVASAQLTQTMGD